MWMRVLSKWVKVQTDRSQKVGGTNDERYRHGRNKKDFGEEQGARGSITTSRMTGSIDEE